MHYTLCSEGIISHIRPQLLLIGTPFTGGIHRTNMVDSHSQYPSTSGGELFNVRSSRHGMPPAYTAPQCLPPLRRPRTNSLPETRMLPALSPAPIIFNPHRYDNIYSLSDAWPRPLTDAFKHTLYASLQDAVCVKARYFKSLQCAHRMMSATVWPSGPSPCLPQQESYSSHCGGPF